MRVHFQLRAYRILTDSVVKMPPL